MSVDPEFESLRCNKNGQPGVKFCRRFASRHREGLRFGILQQQERLRWSVINTETITLHFACIEKLIRDYAINVKPSRTWMKQALHQVETLLGTPDNADSCAAVVRVNTGLCNFPAQAALHYWHP